MRLVVGVTLALWGSACAGRSLSSEDGAGDSGAGGTTGGTIGSGGGGASTGGAGGSVGIGGRGGATGVGGMPAVGGSTPLGGTGGMPATGGVSTTGGTGGDITGGVAGVAGAGAACGLPLVSGSCQAYFPRYGFATGYGHCLSFIYGGCDGNENNFETLAECEAACGGSDLGGCPETMPTTGSACEPLGKPCYYTFGDECLCTVQRSAFCEKIDPTCAPSMIDGGCSGGACPKILVVTSHICECTDDAGWTCGTFYGGGGPP